MKIATGLPKVVTDRGVPPKNYHIVNLNVVQICKLKKKKKKYWSEPYFGNFLKK